MEKAILSLLNQSLHNT